MEEIASLVSTICQQASTPAMRRAAEERLMALQRDPSKWRFHLDLLFYLDDNCVFFVSQGLQHFVWAHWRVLPAEDRDFLTSAITRVISQRGGDLSLYARSKVEQVLAGVCALSGSLGPALSLVREPGQPGVEVGLSTLKTVLEEALSDDRRMTPGHRQLLVKEVTQVAAASSALACRICVDSLVSGSADGPLLTLALDLLRTVVARLPVGAHLSPEVLDALCALAERAIAMPAGYGSEAAAPAGQSMRCARHCRSAISAIHILTELMGKRYIPRGAGADSGVDVLVGLVAKVVGLLQRYKAVCNHSDNIDITLPLLEFIRTFVECHLERCASAPSAAMQAAVRALLDEFACVSRCFTDVELLLNAALVWEELLDVEAIRPLILSSDTALEVAMYLLRQSLVSNNEDLEMQVMDMVDEINLNAIGDPDIRALVAGASSSSPGGGGGGGAEGVEEAGCMGTALLSLTSQLISAFMESDRFMAELRRVVPLLLEEQLASFTAAAASLASGATPAPDSGDCSALSMHAMDILFVSRLLPVCGPPEDTVGRLVGLLAQLVEGGYYRGGRAVVALIMQLCQLVGGICYSCRPGGCYDQQHSVLSASFSAAVPLTRCLASAVGAQVPGDDSLTTQLQVACCVCLLQCVVGLPAAYMNEQVRAEEGEAALGAHILGSVQRLLGAHGAAPLEVTTLLYCTAARISPDVPAAMARSMGEMSAAVVSPADSGVTSMAAWSDAQRAYLAQTCAALGAITQQHAGNSAATRGALLQALEGLDAMLPILISAGCKGVREVVYGAAASASVGMGALKSLSLVLSQMVHLTIGLLQVFGRKSFGRAACTVLGVSADLLSPSETAGGASAVDAALIAVPTGEGLVFLKQLLQLIILLANSSSVAIATLMNELEVSHRLLLVMVGELANSAVCAELLGEIIKAGWTLVTCHWPKQSRQMAAGLSSAVQGQGQTGIDAVVPVVATLVQLFVGCLAGSTIPPQDAVLAIEGLVQANEKFRLFAADWFQSRFLGTVLESTIKAVLMGHLPGHVDLLDRLLEMVCTDAGTAVWPAFKEISGSVAAAASCNPQVVTELIAEEEGNAVRRSNAVSDGGSYSSSTSSEQEDLRARSVFSGMKAVLVTLASEIIRCKEPTSFA
jgi:hypothetical protein